MHNTIERLRKNREERSEHQGGFTLIELLIVIVILGILAAIVVFAVNGLTSNSAVAACQSDYKTVETAVAAYDTSVGSYPGSIAALDTTTAGTNGATVGPFISANDLNSSGLLVNGSHYQIVTSGGTITVESADGTTATYGTTQAACSKVG